MYVHWGVWLRGVMQTEESDSAVWCKPRSLTPQCDAKRGVWHHGVMQTEESDSAVSCTLRSLTLRCHAPKKSGYLVVNKILIKTSLLGVILQCYAHREVLHHGGMQTRVGNSLFVFSCELLVFWEQKSESVVNSFQSVNGSRHSFLMSDGSECHLLRWRVLHSFVLGIKKGKAWWKEWIGSESLLKRVNHSFIKCESIQSKDDIISRRSLQKEWREQKSENAKE